jgi:hypothetical protein
MGEFTQNLLKLTEFPFSYSLMGLLALIFGQGTNLVDLSSAKIGPLLILMGFVATTLSICDPMGALQRRIIKTPKLIKLEEQPNFDLNKIELADPFYAYPRSGMNLPVYGDRNKQKKSINERKESIKLIQMKDLNSFLNKMIFGRFIRYHFPVPYIFAIMYSPEDIKRKIDYPKLNEEWEHLIFEWKFYEEHAIYRQRVVTILSFFSDRLRDMLIVRRARGTDRQDQMDNSRDR